MANESSPPYQADDLLRLSVGFFSQHRKVTVNIKTVKLLGFTVLNLPKGQVVQPSQEWSMTYYVDKYGYVHTSREECLAANRS